MNLKTIIPLIMGWLTMSFMGLSQSTNQNYVKTLTARDALKGSLSVEQNSQLKVQTDMTYIDGLGRTTQEVMRAASPDGKDIVKLYTYDAIGRIDKDYLPFQAGTTSGAYQNSVLSGLEGFYDAPPIGVDTIDYPYSQTLFESSPLNRVIESSAPGTPWRSSMHGGTHVVTVEYQFNGSNEIRLITADDSPNQVMTSTGYYVTNQLRGTLTTDEDGNQMLEYADKAGKVVCKINALGTADETYTYYVYDDYDLLTFVIPPQAVAEIGSNWSLLNDTSFRNRWLFRYQYDERNRMIEKQVPGAEKVEMVYDKRDRLVFTLDGNRRNVATSSASSGPIEYVENGTLIVDSYQGKSYVRAHGARIVFKKPNFSASKHNNFSVTKTTGQVTYQNHWIYTKYDALNRPVMTGLKPMTQNRNDLQTLIDNDSNYDFSVSYVGNTSGDVFGYDDTSYPQASGTEVLTVTYYDNYDFVTDFNWGTAYTYSGHFTHTIGQATGSLTKLLGSEPKRHLKSVTYYDDRLRPKATMSENYFGKADEVVNTYRNDVSPLITRITSVHRKGTSATTVVEDFTYDHRDRLLTQTHAVVGHGTKPLVNNTYNAIGQLIEKDLHDDGTPAQSVDYRYNERGWLTTINGGSGDFDDPSTDQFGMELKYHDAPSPNFNGNIGQLLWKAKEGGQTEVAQNYRYTYDNLNRLKSADYTGSDNYDVSNITYDKNGNILTLQRNSIDNLDYDYFGNQLTRVEDATSITAGFKDVSSAVGTQEYSYDKNGNMISDTNKGITNIQYNYLNLPQQVTLSTGNIVQYAYDAAGIKHQKTFNGKEWIYAGAFHYEKEASEGSTQLEFLQHTEGRALYNNGTWNYEYNLTDHLGNVRVSVNESGAVVQRDGYYPFGMSFNSSADSPENLYKYNGFEEQKETGWYDYLARQYDPELGRFTSIDPAADLMRRQGPYNYAFNNPIRFIDPDGMMPEEAGKENGGSYSATLKYTLKDDDKNVHELNLSESWDMQTNHEDGSFTVVTYTQNTTVTTTLDENDDPQSTVSVSLDKTTKTFTLDAKKGGYTSESNTEHVSQKSYESFEEYKNSSSTNGTDIQKDLAGYQQGLNNQLLANPEYNPYNGSASIGGDPRSDNYVDGAFTGLAFFWPKYSAPLIAAVPLGKLAATTYRTNWDHSGRSTTLVKESKRGNRSSHAH